MPKPHTKGEWHQREGLSMYSDLNCNLISSTDFVTVGKLLIPFLDSKDVYTFKYQSYDRIGITYLYQNL